MHTAAALYPFRFNVAAHSPKVVSVPLHSGHKHTTVQWSSLFSLSAALIYIQIAIPNHFFLLVLLFFAAIFLQAEKMNGVGFYDLNIFFLLLYCLFSELLLSFSFCVYFSPLAQGLLGRRRSTMAGSFYLQSTIEPAFVGRIHIETGLGLFSRNTLFD